MKKFGNLMISRYDDLIICSTFNNSRGFNLCVLGGFAGKNLFFALINDRYRVARGCHFHLLIFK